MKILKEKMMLDYNTKSGIIGGTLLSILTSISWGDVVFTIVMATIGAVVSFIVSMFLRWFVKQLKY